MSEHIIIISRKKKQLKKNMYFCTMKRNIIISFLLAVIIIAQLFIGCNGTYHYDSRLIAADRMMCQNTDSALSILTQLGKDGFMNRADRAYHALLLSQAKYRCYVPATSDSTINVALDYYQKHQDENEKLTRSLIYKGAIMEELGESESAMKYYKKALATVSLNDYFNQGYVKLRIGNIYRDNMVADSSDVTIFKEALHHFEQANDSSYILTCLSEIGSSYIKTNHDSVLAYLDKAKSLAQKLNDKSIELDYMIYIADIKMYSRSPHDIADAKDIALSLLRNNNYADDRKSHIMMIAALTLAKQEKPDSASIFLNQVPTENLSAGLRVLYEKCLAELFISKGDIREYQQHYEKSEDIADSIASNSRQQVLRDVEAKYDNESLKYENLRFKSKLVISVLSGLFLLSILTIALMIVSRKSLLRKRQLQVSEETIAQLNIDKTLLATQLNNNLAMSDELKLTFKQQVETFLQLVQSHVTIFASDPKKFGKLFQQSYNTNQPSSSFWRGVRSYADNQLNNIITRTKDNCPSLREKDLNFLSLYCIGMPTTVIMACMGYAEAHSVYNKKRRLATTMGLEEPLDDYIKGFKSSVLEGDLDGNRAGRVEGK